MKNTLSIVLVVLFTFSFIAGCQKQEGKDKSKAAAINTSSNQTDDSKKQLESAQAELKKSKNETSQLRNLVESANAKILALESDKKQVKSQVEALIGNINSSAKDFEQIKKATTDLEQRLKTLQEQATNLAKKLEIEISEEDKLDSDTNSKESEGKSDSAESKEDMPKKDPSI